MSASREAEQLSAYAALVRKWNPAINLVAPSTLDDLELRHLQDSVQLADMAANSDGAWVDLGSGGGFPAIAVAIRYPEMNLTMLDSDQRKIAFLRTCIRTLGLTRAKAVAARIESHPPLAVANISARALAPLQKLLPLVARHLAPSGTAWLMKGRGWQAEVEEARHNWHFTLAAHPSITDPDAAILQLTELRHA